MPSRDSPKTPISDAVAIESAKRRPIGAYCAFDMDDGVWATLCDQHGVLAQALSRDLTRWVMVAHNDQLHQGGQP